MLTASFPFLLAEVSCTGAKDEDDNMTGGSKIVKSGSCMGPGGVNSSWVDDREDVEVNEDWVERSVTHCKWAFAKRSFLTWLESVLSPIFVVLQMFASSSMMTNGEVTLVATSDRIHSGSSQKCSHFLQSWQGSNINKHMITNVKSNVCLHSVLYTPPPSLNGLWSDHSEC